MNPKNNVFIITAAGGNATAIQVLNSALSRTEYSRQGGKLAASTAQYDVEQCGFLIPADNHFEMRGGEFCGNAARAAAILFSQLAEKEEVEFTMSGFSRKVHAIVRQSKGSLFDVTCGFIGLQTKTKAVYALMKRATLVDLGGIVHVIIESPMPEDYETQHRQITQDLDLTKRDAVGVIWQQRSGNQVVIHPVVWVRDGNTFFYEGSCGSGSIAVGKTTGIESIIQPSGQSINVKFIKDSIILQSNMEITHELELCLD